jgi:hypothetical protein
MVLQLLLFAIQKFLGSLNISSWVTVQAQQAIGIANKKSQAVCILIDIL